MVIPTLIDPSMAPPGKHVISCFVQYAPYDLAPELGAWDEKREAFGDTVIDRDRRVRAEPPRRHPAPAGPDAARHRAEYGLTEGNIFQGELQPRAALLQPTRCPGTRGSGRPCATSGCAARRRIPAAGSWAPTAGSPRSRCFDRSVGRSRDGPIEGRGRLGCHRHRRRPQRPGRPRPWSRRPASAFCPRATRDRRRGGRDDRACAGRVRSDPCPHGRPAAPFGRPTSST